MFENERDSSTVFCFNLKSWIDHYANGRMPTFWPTPQLAPLPLANSSQPCLAGAWQTSPICLPLYIPAMTFVIFRRVTCTWPATMHAKFWPIEILNGFESIGL